MYLKALTKERCGLMKLSSIGKVIDFIEKICAAVSVVSVVLMMLLVSADVIGRKFFQHPIPGVVEIVEEYLMIAVVFMAMSYIYLKGGHVRVTLFRRFFPEKVKLPLDIIINILGLIFFALIAVEGWQTTVRAVRFHETSACILDYPLAPAYFIMTLGVALLCVRIIETIFSPSKIKWDD